MPRYVVKQPNGRFAVFSTIVDHFVEVNQTEAEMRAYWVREIGERDGNAKVDRAIADDMTGIGEVTAADGLNRWRDAIDTIRLIRGEEEAKETERDILGWTPEQPDEE